MEEQQPRPAIQSVLVTAEQMQQIEGRLFDAGMPVAALMEKVSEKIMQWFIARYGSRQGHIGVLAGPGHNGGDALVVARELFHIGYDVSVYQPFSKLKPLTEQHARYAKSIGIPFVETVERLVGCDAVIDGWFGFGLTRPITDELAADIQYLNNQTAAIFSIDLPSGIHTDTGQVMGTAIKATYTACLGLWKRGFMQEEALVSLGKCSLIDFDIPLADIAAVLGESPAIQRLTDRQAIAHLPLKPLPNRPQIQSRPSSSHSRLQTICGCSLAQWTWRDRQWRRHAHPCSARIHSPQPTSSITSSITSRLSRNRRWGNCSSP